MNRAIFSRGSNIFPDPWLNRAAAGIEGKSQPDAGKLNVATYDLLNRMQYQWDMAASRCQPVSAECKLSNVYNGQLVAVQ
jgi:hypothetical protein